MVDSTGLRDSSLTHRAMFARSSLFGEAPSFLQIKRLQEDGNEVVFAVEFWYFFRKFLALAAPMAFFGIFLITFFVANETDGFVFFGSLLSIVSGIFVCGSYVHVIHWRRHPSALIMHTSLMSTLFSIILAGNAGSFSTYLDGTEVDTLSTSGNNSYDHTAGCMTMSFFIQLTLLSREMWILTLSLDLFASITNPFASYSWNLKKYNICIAVVGLLCSLVLISQR
jgi:hypothetical protein